MTTLDEQLAALARDGVQVNNLFQLPDGSWQANLRREEFTGFGRASTAGAAVSAALATGFAVTHMQAQETHMPPSVSADDLGI